MTPTSVTRYGRFSRSGAFKGGLLVRTCFLGLSLGLMVFPGVAWSSGGYSLYQQQTVSGRVTDDAGNALAGVSVRVKGTTTGTATAADGTFSVAIAGNGAILVFSYLGYQSREVEVTARQGALAIVLQPAVSALNDVVVVGYGTEKKVNLTGAVSTVSSEQIERSNLVSVSNALQGVAPGVTVTSQSGAPGGDQSAIHIRGISSFGGSSSDPLVIIDGVAGSIDDIDANAIESVSVLKDAASAAIYGSRAANGVILITTKRAKNTFSINYKGYVGKQRAIAIPEVTNGLTYMRVFNAASMNDNGSKIYSDEDIAAFKEAYQKDPDNYDWQKAILQGSGLVHSHYLSVSASGDVVRATPSFSYVDQQGIIDHTNYKRYIFRNNMDITPSDKFNITFDMSVTNRNRLQIPNESDIWNYMGRMPTNIPIRYGDLWSEGWVKKNPVAFIDDGGDRKTNNLEFFGNLTLNYMPAEWLTLSGKFAPRYLTSNTHTFTKSVMTYHQDGSEAGASDTYTDLSESAYRYFYGTYQFTATAEQSFQDRHHFSLLAGTSRETYDEKYLYGYRRDFVYDNYEQLTAGANDATKDNDGARYQWLLVSAFGRLKYNFEGKYLFEANLRYDGSSRFTGGNQWAAFPSFSAGWNISEESFMDELRATFSMLKLRASWGKLGNQNIGSSYYPFAEPLALSSVSMGGNVYQMIAQTTLSNPGLRWESTTMRDIGIDINVMEKLSVTFDYYHKKTDGILLKLNTSQLTGMASPYQNAAVVSNKGWELTARYDNNWGDFRLGVGLNLSDVKNEILDMHGQSSGTLLRQQEGYAINSIYGYVADGLYQSTAEINAGPTQIGSLKPGDIRYVDVAGAEDENGKSIPDGTITDADKKIIGSTIPRYTYGLGLNLQWKGLRLDAFFQGVGKVDGYLNSHYVIPAANSSSIKPWQLDYWTEDNRDAALPRVSITSANNTQNSTFWMRSAAYLRLKNIQLGYEIPKQFLSKYGIKGLLVYVSGTNVFTLTDFYTGYDPEINYNRGAAEGVSLGSGSYYPQVQTFRFGIDLNL